MKQTVAAVLSAGMLAVASAADVAIFPTMMATEASADSVEQFVHQHIGASAEWREAYDFRLESSSSINGNSFQKYVQVANGVTVKDGQITVHVDGNNVRSIVGSVSSEIISAKAGLSKEDAKVAFQAAFPMMKVYSEPELLIKKDTLTYGATVEFVNHEGKLSIGQLYVDAHSGKVVEFDSTMYNALNREVYQYPDECTFFWNTNVPGDLLLKEGGHSPVEKATQVYDNMGTVYHFYKNQYNRDSFDNRGHKLVGTIELLYTDKIFGGECFGDNAAWVGDPYNQMLYFVDGEVFEDIEQDLTVIAHEMSHAVTDKTSSLVYKDESGAINEAFSDVMAAVAHVWADNGGDENGNPKTWLTTEKHYWIGEDCVSDEWPYEALRFMNNPTLDGKSPDNYLEIQRGAEDNGYVHSNSGIFNLFFYLLAEGGNHPRIPSNEVTGLGIEKAGRIVYTANTQIFTASTTFEQARYHCASAAEALYGKGSQEVLSVHQAMDAVKVPGKMPVSFTAPMAAKLRGAPIQA